MTRLRQHEFPDVEGNRWCRWCGALWHPQMTALCLQREISPSDLAPEPKRREYACEAWDDISARVAELAKERLPVEPEPEPQTHMDLGDCCG